MIFYYSATVNPKCHPEIVLQSSNFMLSFAEKGRAQGERLKLILRQRGRNANLLLRKKRHSDGKEKERP